ncbi:MAG: right-handed parallel beta-helix repeat-containing protein [Puniceicoccaceae bacterium]|nr:MAG: right-handed parallel beta-helix repeat-containing protein [Puniceicoccaceae bacterium]
MTPPTISSTFPNAARGVPSHGRLRAALLPILGCLVAASAAREGEVVRVDDTWQSKVEGAEVYRGPDMVAAIQAAVNGLTPGREHKETVHVRASGAVLLPDPMPELVSIEIPSHTVLNFHGHTLHVEEGERVVPLRARDARRIEVRNLRITGTPRFGIFMKGCQEVVLANLRLELGLEGDPESRGGAGIRTEGGDAPWSGEWNRDFVLDNIYVANTRGHGVELWRTDGLTVTTITTRNTGYAGLLLNQTRNAKIDLVDAWRANPGGGYAGFRTANDAGPNIEVRRVVAVECGRGVFTVSGSQGITIHEVEIARSTGHGMLIEDTENFVVHGGTIVDCGAEGVRINSRRLGQGPGSDHHPSSKVTVQNLRIMGCPWGIRETLPRTHGNRILNNDLRGNRNCLEVQGEGTVAEGNRCE